MIEWLFGLSEKDRSPEGVDDRVYQRKNGTMYIKSDEFVRSEEGRKLLERFSENIDDCQSRQQC